MRVTHGLFVATLLSLTCLGLAQDMSVSAKVQENALVITACETDQPQKQTVLSPSKPLACSGPYLLTFAAPTSENETLKISVWKGELKRTKSLAKDDVEWSLRIPAKDDGMVEVVLETAGAGEVRSYFMLKVVSSSGRDDTDVSATKIGLTYVMGLYDDDQFLLDRNNMIRKQTTTGLSDASALMVHFTPPRDVDERVFRNPIGRMFWIPGMKPGDTLRTAFSFGLPTPGSTQPAQYYFGFSLLYGRQTAYAVTFGYALAEVDRLSPGVDMNQPWPGGPIPTFKHRILRPFLSLSYNFDLGR